MRLQSERRHEVLMITLKSGENWVINFDVKILIPLVAYLRENQCREIQSRVLDFGSSSSNGADDNTDFTISMDEAEMEPESMPDHSPQNWLAQYIKLRIEGNRAFRKKLITGSTKTFQAMMGELQGDVKDLVTTCLGEIGERKVGRKG